MNPVLAAALGTGSVSTPGGEKRPLHSAIGREEGLFLQAMVRRRRPRISVEVGCAYGISSLFLCEALKEAGAAKHIIIDPLQTKDWEGVGLHNLRLAQLDDIVEFHEETSDRCLPRLAAAGVTLDLAFVDGMHTFDYAFVDFYFINRMLGIGGILIFDDVNFPAIRKLCRYILTNLSYRAIGPAAAADAPVRHRLQLALGRLPLLRGIAAPEFVLTDERLGIPRANYIAMEKTGLDTVGDGTGGTRHWAAHHPF